MKLTGFQRVTLGIAIIAGSLFVAGILYKHNQTKTGSTKPPPVADTQEAVILKSLFLNDFGPQLNRARDETSLTIGCKTNKFPEMTLPFTAQLYLDFHEGTQFLGFYTPVQDKGPGEASRTTVLLCRIFLTTFQRY